MCFLKYQQFLQNHFRYFTPICDWYIDSNIEMHWNLLRPLSQNHIFWRSNKSDNRINEQHWCHCFGCSCRVPVLTCGSLRVPAFRKWCSRLTPFQGSCTGTPSGNWGPYWWTAAWQWGKLPPELSGDVWTALFRRRVSIKPRILSLHANKETRIKSSNFCECHYIGPPFFWFFKCVNLFFFQLDTIPRNWLWTDAGWGIEGKKNNFLVTLKLHVGGRCGDEIEHFLSWLLEFVL